MSALLFHGERLPAHYNPALDGIRAIAVLLVMAFHPGIPGFKETFIYGSLIAFIAAAISYHLMEQRIALAQKTCIQT